MGGTLVEPGEHVSNPREGLRLALRRFKRTILLVASLTLSTDERLFFDPAKSQLCRLKEVGFSNHVSCISGSVFLSNSLRDHLLYGLLSLRMAITGRVKQSIKQGSLYIKPCKLSYRGTPTWLKLGVVSSEIPAVSGLACMSGVTMFSARRTGAYWLACNHCSIRTDMQCSTLFLKGKWASLKCQYCGSCSSARKWSCTCGVPWHGCCDHAKRGFACRAKPRRCSTGTSQAEQFGPSNCRPAPTLPVNVPSARKRNFTLPDRRPKRVVAARTPRVRNGKRKALDRSASEREAVARLKDARLNPIPVDCSQVPHTSREKSRRDATHPCGMYKYRDPG